MKPEEPKRALLVAGGINQRECHARYANELAWWASSLEARGFSCRIAHANGSTSPSFVGLQARVFAALTPLVNGSLVWLGKATDLAVLVVSNHGDADGLCLWGNGRVTPGDVGSLIGNTVNAAAVRVLVFGQCNGGVFAQLASSRTVVISASGPNEPSWACTDPPGLEFDEFLYQFGTALFGAPSSAAQAGPGTGLSLADAFAWAKARDRRPETPALIDPAGIAKGIVL